VVFWATVPCSVLAVSQHYGQAYCFHRKDRHEKSWEVSGLYKVGGWGQRSGQLEPCDEERRWRCVQAVSVPRSVHVGFVVDRVAQGQVFLWDLWFFLYIIPLWLSILIYHGGCSSETLSHPIDMNNIHTCLTVVPLEPISYFPLFRVYIFPFTHHSPGMHIIYRCYAVSLVRLSLFCIWC
jgi:hypothetical protein